MKLLRKMLFWPFGRRKVDDAVLADFAGIFESKLEGRGLKNILSQPLLARLVQEAYARAGSQETDGVPRYHGMWTAVENISDSVASVLAGNSDIDAAIHAILVHHHVMVPTSSLPMTRSPGEPSC
jgi:hypothetical protein